MAFVISLIAGFSVFLAGQMGFRRYALLPPLDSLRLGRVHYLLLGILVGVFFPENDSVFRPFEMVRYSLIGAILLWIGLQTGLTTDLQRLRSQDLSRVYAQIIIVLTTVAFSILAALASGTILYNHLGLNQNLSLAIVLLTCFAITVRFPDPLFHGTNSALPSPTPHLPVGNIAALVVLSASFPFVAENPAFYIGNMAFVGTLGFALLTAGLSLSGGIALDFAFRSHRTGSRALSVAFGIVITLSGLSQAPGLPALSVGFLAGAWLINTTVAKRDVIELTARANDIIEPVFFVLLGTIMGGFGGGPFFLLAPLFPLAGMMMLVRGMGRAIGLSVSQAIWQVPETWREFWSMSWHPQGTLSVALSVQALYILDFHHHTFIAGLVLSVFISQTILVPLDRKPKIQFPNQNRD